MKVFLIKAFDILVEAADMLWEALGNVFAFLVAAAFILEGFTSTTTFTATFLLLLWVVVNRIVKRHERKTEMKQLNG